MEMSGQIQAPASLFPGKSPWYPLDEVEKYGVITNNVSDSYQ
jgi:hypothetical protein